MSTRRNILVGAAALAAMPAVARAEDGAEYVPVPIVVTPGYRIAMTLRINGTGPYVFIMDTGADASGIRSDLARSLGLKFTSGQSFSGVGGEEIEGIYLAKEVQFGPYLHQKGVAFSGMPHFKICAGLVAAGFLTTLPSVLDCGAKEIRIYTRGLPDLGEFVPVDSYLDARDPYGSAQIYVHVTIAGVPLKLLVDTGAPYHMVVFPSVVRAHGLWDKYGAGVEGKTSGISGTIVSIREVSMPDFALSDVMVPHLPVTLMNPDAHNDNNGVDGVLGMRFLELFAVAITKKGMALRPLAGAASAASSASS